jgi:hypothetical protein
MKLFLPVDIVSVGEQKEEEVKKKKKNEKER